MGAGWTEGAAPEEPWHYPDPGSRRIVIDKLGESVIRWRFVVVLLWLSIAGGLNLLVPQLEIVATERSAAMVPADAHGMKVLDELGSQFDEPSANGLAYLVVERDSGLTEDDRRYHDAVVEEARKDDRVASVQNLWSDSATAASAVSEDGKAAYTMIRLSSDTGTPGATDAITALREDLSAISRPAGLEAEITGLGASVADEFHGVHTSLQLITGITVVLIALLLLAVYRSLAIAAIPLLTIGLGIGVARPVVALMGLHGSPISIFSLALLAALILGAGTDYAIFLISRYHEERRGGLDRRAAFVRSYSRISAVILASALVVALTSASMSVAQVGLFRSIGLPSAVGIVVVAAAAVTLTPALLAIASERGLAEPKAHAASDYWRGVAVWAVRRPVRTLAASLAVLAVLALIVPTAVLSLDERATIADDADSNRGYDMVAQHFEANELLPITMLIQSSSDMRNSAGFATVERISARIAALDGVASVRGVSRPLGHPLVEGSVGRQAGEVGDRLDAAVVQLASTSGERTRLVDGMTRFANGAKQLEDGTARVADGTSEARDGSDRLVDGTMQLTAGLSQLSAGADQLAVGLQQANEGAALLQNRVEEATAPALGALGAVSSLRGLVAAAPHCDLDPMCSATRALLDAVDGSALGQVDQLRTGVEDLAEGNAQLAAGVATLTTELNRALTGADRLRDGQITLHSGLVDLDDGANATRTGARQLSEGAGPLATGVTQLTDGVEDIGKGLEQAVDYLSELKENASSDANGGFYLPTSAVSDPRLQPAMKLFFSPDGHSARLMIVTTGDAFSESARAQSTQIVAAAETVLAQDAGITEASVGVTGPSILFFELGDYATDDLMLIVLVASALIFLILAAMLRSVVAPTYILVSVLVSYLAALGLSTLVWQHIFDLPLHWAVPSMSFIALVAIGADYNLLLMSRVREELHSRPGSGTRSAIVRAVTGTGGVITVAAVIFAITMFALLSSSVTNVGQIGFTIGTGLLIDAMIVRTLTIPALATLLGRWNWWPGRPPNPSFGLQVATGDGPSRSAAPTTSSGP